MGKRKSIEDWVRLKLWVKSAGRCQFKGCNKPVWRNNLTLSEANFADVAHIIGSSKKGPRGNEDSQKLQTDYSNLMLLCKTCHKEIDTFEEKYGVEVLREMKSIHEERIERHTKIVGENSLTTILQFQSRIRTFMPSIHHEAMFNAVIPQKFPIDDKGIRISFPDFNDQGENIEWELTSKKIKEKIDNAFKTNLDGESIKHLSVFAIGSIPLLIYLGVCIGDIIPADIFESHRNIKDTNKTWCWEKNIIKLPKIKSKDLEIKSFGKNVILILAISDDINKNQYENLLDENTSIYKIYIDKPVPGFVKSPTQIEEFSKLYRRTINRIQETHGMDCVINICPALPISLAVECGRVLLTTKDSNIYACQYFKARNEMKPVLRIC